MRLYADTLFYLVGCSFASLLVFLFFFCWLAGWLADWLVRLFAFFVGVGGIWEAHNEYTNPHRAKVGKRRGTSRLQAKGIFPGANVVRGPDWKWENQDGGEGKEGVVIDIRNWKHVPSSCVLVSWNYAKKGMYRVGFEGKVGLFIFLFFFTYACACVPHLGTNFI